jgi:hypothetical protein
MARINLGDTARDRITGFEGVVTGTHDWLNGCRTISIQPPKLKEDGLPVDPKSFDEPQLILISSAVRPVHESPTPAIAGGPKDEPTRRLSP